LVNGPCDVFCFGFFWFLSRDWVFERNCCTRLFFFFTFPLIFFLYFPSPHNKNKKKACEFLFVCKLIFFPAARLLGAFSCSLLLGGGRSWEKGLFSKFSIFLFFLFFSLLFCSVYLTFFLLFLLPVGFRWREGGRQRKKRNKKERTWIVFFLPHGARPVSGQAGFKNAPPTEAELHFS